MFRNPIARWILGLVTLIALLSVVRFKPWRHVSFGGGASGQIHAREELRVGFLPVTCHLTCPVTDFATRTSNSTRFESQRFTDFPTIVESLKSGRSEEHTSELQS